MGIFKEIDSIESEIIEIIYEHFETKEKLINFLEKTGLYNYSESWFHFTFEGKASEEEFYVIADYDICTSYLEVRINGLIVFDNSEILDLS